MTVDEEQLINDFIGFNSISKISASYGLHRDDVCTILRNSLSHDNYIRICRIIGGRTTALKMQNPSFKSQYKRKMSKSVSSALRKKMADPSFRKKWLSKTKKASKKGNDKIRRLLINNHFYEKWLKKCSKGGVLIKNTKKGIFDPILQEKRKNWSLAGLKNTRRKIRGPLGEKMYNYLEASVAKVFISAGLKYEYEYQFHANNMNNFMSIDFVIADQKLLVEVTYWDKIYDKCLQLKKKFIQARALFPGYHPVVITKKSMRDYFKRLLPDSTKVLTLDELGVFVAGLKHSNFSGVTNSIN